jgi:hypothetical protein
VRVFNRLIISLALAFGLINTVLGLYGQDDIAVYFIVNSIAYLIITLLYVYLNPRTKAALNALSTVIFAGFMVTVAIKVIEILK